MRAALEARQQDVKLKQQAAQTAEEQCGRLEHMLRDSQVAEPPVVVCLTLQSYRVLRHMRALLTVPIPVCLVTLQATPIPEGTVSSTCILVCFRARGPAWTSDSIWWVTWAFIKASLAGTSTGLHMTHCICR